MTVIFSYIMVMRAGSPDMTILSAVVMVMVEVLLLKADHRLGLGIAGLVAVRLRLDLIFLLWYC
jgi:hypothetical protein